MRSCFRLIVSAAVLSASALLAFNPPADARHGVTLSLEGVPQAVAADQPLTFAVQLSNASASNATGTVTLQLTDDWRLDGPSAFAVSVAPQQTWKTACVARASARVLNARYAAHARFALGAEELHPVAVFKAVRPPAPAAAPARELAPGLGVTRLAHVPSSAAGWERDGRTTALPAGFSGADRACGASWFQEREVVRGGEPLTAISAHPPWKGGPGTLWSDYRLALPTNTPVLLKFTTAIRDTLDEEPASDGVDFRVFACAAGGPPRELFARFSAAKAWQPAEVDLSAYAGRPITLRLWIGPGPKRDTTCDNGFWGDPLLLIGPAPAPTGEAEWAARLADASASAADAAAHKPRAPGAFALDVRGERFGAAVVLGREGLLDAALAFSDGTRALAFRGFTVEFGGQPVGALHDGQPVCGVDVARRGSAWIITHHISSPLCASAPPRETVSLRATLTADHGALRVAWDRPSAPSDPRGERRFTKLALGPGERAPLRVYMGFGAVFEKPGAFSLPYGGVQLGTRHVGADYESGLSLVQASDRVPERVTCAPGRSLFALETPDDACLLFVPSARGAYAAARAYRDVCGFEKAKGVDALLGRVCLDQWGGDYRAAASDLDLAGKYGLHHSVFVKHDWQRWGYDYRLPDIYPPSGGLAPFREMREAARRSGMLFAPHDNYIDFYPDATGFSYDRVVFQADGTPHEAWYNPGRDAQSYRWLPDAFTPWLTDNMRRMREGFGPDALFIDVFTSIAPFDTYDRSGAFHTRAETVTGWRAAFDTCRKLLGHDAPMLSESGHDALIGSIDGVQADHWRPDCWLKSYGDADRTPWHDMATHGKMVLFAGGLGHRYDEDDAHGYGSDDYLSNTVLGGRAPMCDGPFSRRAVMTYWLLHDVCDALARSDLEAHAFGATVRQQHTTFSNGGEAWANRGSNVWRVADGRTLPAYGFYVKAAGAEAGVLSLAGRRAGFAASDGLFFADARPQPDPEPGCHVETRVASAERIGPRAHRLTVEWNVLAPLEPGYLPFVHVGRASADSGERIEAQAGLAFDLSNLTRTGAFTSTTEIRLPAELAPGDYFVRYGLFHRQRGDRVPLRGDEERQRRIRAGVLRVSATGDEYLVREPLAENSDLNIAGEMLAFGPLATDGAFRLSHADRRAWTLLPLPASRPFRAELRLARLGAKRGASVARVERIDPFFASAKEPDWKQEGDTLRLSADALSFGYRIVFK